MFGTDIHQPYSSPGLNSEIKSQPSIEPRTPGFRSKVSGMNVDQSPLMQQDANLRSYRLRYDAARIVVLGQLRLIRKITIGPSDPSIDDMGCAILIYVLP